MVKVVENGERICTVTLDGSESSVVFQNDYKYFAVKNESDADVYVSLNRDIVEGADGVMTIGSKESALFAHMKPNVNMFFVKGKGKIQVFASSNAINPFKSAPASDGGGVQASGNPVQINGLQGGVPFSEITVSGKNLLKYPYNESTKTVNGITFTDNGDGTITANGTATANATFLLARNFGFEKEGNYFLSGCPSGGGLNSFYINWYQNHTGVTIKNYNDYGSGVKIPYQHIFSENNSLAISIIAGATVENLVFRPQLELGDTPTAYESPITGRELQVNVCGKNLFGDVMNYYLSGTQTNGFNFKPSSANSFCFLGTIINNTNYTIKNYSNGNRFKIVLFKNYPNQAAPDECMEILPTDSNTVTFNSGEYNYCVLSVAYNDENITIKKAQLEIGITPTDYEQYHGSTTTITPDSNPYIVPNDIRQQDGYNVVSVSEGELSVTGVRKNAALKKIWDEMGMDLLFDGVTSANNPAVIDLANYNMIRIDVGGNFEGTSYFNCGSTYFLKSTLDYAVTSYGRVAMAMSNQAVVINISKSEADYSLSFTGFNAKQLVEAIKIYGIK